MLVKRLDYNDGGWCEQEYEDGKLHGRWTVYYPSGNKNWERQYQRGRQEGYERNWDEQGCLREEKAYHLGVLHGLWREWDADGTESIVGDFRFGRELEFYERYTPPPHSNWERVWPYWTWEPALFRSQIKEVEHKLAVPACSLKRDSSRPFRDEFGASYFSYVNLLGSKEQWPTSGGVPLIPLLQIDCRALECRPHYLMGVAFLTMFARHDPVQQNRDLVIRTYGAGDDTRHVKPPQESIAEQPHFMQIGPPWPSYPDDNDLPPGLRVFLEDEMPDSPLLKKREDRFSTRFSGWPSWIQWSTVDPYGELVLQVDRLDIATLRGGDSALHYFFVDQTGWTWASESLSPLYTPSGPH